MEVGRYVPRGLSHVQIGVVACTVVAAALALVYVPQAIDRFDDGADTNAAANYDDREFAGGNAVVVDHRRWLPWAIVLGAALAYPLAVLAGGSPKFPSRDDCVQPAVDGAPIVAVLSYVDTEHEARAVRARAHEVGFEGVEIARNACGRVKVLVPGIPTLEVGHEFAREAERVGFDVTLEQAG